jgi:hypothetical protein
MLLKDKEFLSVRLQASGCRAQDPRTNLVNLSCGMRRKSLAARIRSEAFERAGSSRRVSPLGFAFTFSRAGNGRETSALFDRMEPSARERERAGAKYRDSSLSKKSGDFFFLPF